jgi:hypothetical protein
MTIVLRPWRSVELATLLVSNRKGIVAHHFAYLLCEQHQTSMHPIRTPQTQKGKIPEQNLRIELIASTVQS